MVGSQTAFSVLDEAAAAIGGWTALQSMRCVHLDSEGQDWEPWQAYDIGGTVDVSTLLHTSASPTPICRSQLYYLFFRQFQKQNLHSAFWKRSAQRGL
jgi:hypothetical protein